MRPRAGEQRTGEKAISRRIAVHVEIDKAQSMEVREEQRVANVKQLSLINTNGPITVQGATGEKLVFKTGDGTIDANNLSGHQIFLSGGEDGALVHAADVRLESGDANCREGVAVSGIDCG